jgi:predicted transglutaminase-like cysteine proteinase
LLLSGSSGRTLSRISYKHQLNRIDIMNKFARILVAAISFWTAIAFAQDRHGTAEQRAACAPDAFRLCAGYIPDASKVESCSRLKQSELSDQCQSAFAQSPVSTPFQNPRRQPSGSIIAPGFEASLTSVEGPFAPSSLSPAYGPLVETWQSVKLAVLADMARLTLCAAQESACSQAARALLNVVTEARRHDGLARVGVINRAINLAIKPTIVPFWQSPLEALSSKAGDCKDYAVAKYLALQEAGIAESDVKLVIVRDIAAHQDHAVVTVRLYGDWFVLDNRWLALTRDFEFPRTEPLYVLDGRGVRRFVPQAVNAGDPQLVPREHVPVEWAAGAVNSKFYDENGTQKIEPSVTPRRCSTELSLLITA